MARPRCRAAMEERHRTHGHHDGGGRHRDVAGERRKLARSQTAGGRLRRRLDGGEDGIDRAIRCLIRPQPRARLERSDRGLVRALMPSVLRERPASASASMAARSDPRRVVESRAGRPRRDAERVGDLDEGQPSWWCRTKTAVARRSSVGTPGRARRGRRRDRSSGPPARRPAGPGCWMPMTGDAWPRRSRHGRERGPKPRSGPGRAERGS